MTPSKPRALLDTTVFCGALVKPSGVNMRILLAGNGGIFYRPIIAQSVVAEFIGRAIRGIGHGTRLRRYTPVGTCRVTRPGEFLSGIGFDPNP